MLLLAAALLGGCNTLVAQNPSSPAKPVNAVRHGDDFRLMLGGNDVVAYFSDGQAMKGSSDHRSEYDAVTYHFASATNRAMFEGNPVKFRPQYHGFCAVQVANALAVPGDAQSWTIVDGRLFIFADATSKAAFELDTAAFIARADQYWASEVLGTNSLWQRVKRTLNRVPDFKSDEELARQVTAAKAKSG
ncbi:MAG: YHS domain-containing (seleno)protein [Rubrivivax sp.]